MRKLQFEAATKMKTVDDLELKVKDMEYRLATMEAIKEPIVTAVATLAKAVDESGMQERTRNGSLTTAQPTPQQFTPLRNPLSTRSAWKKQKPSCKVKFLFSIFLPW